MLRNMLLTCDEHACFCCCPACLLLLAVAVACCIMSCVSCVCVCVSWLSHVSPLGFVSLLVAGCCLPTSCDATNYNSTRPPCRRAAKEVMRSYSLYMHLMLSCPPRLCLGVGPQRADSNKATTHCTGWLLDGLSKSFARRAKGTTNQVLMSCRGKRWAHTCIYTYEHT